MQHFYGRHTKWAAPERVTRPPAAAGGEQAVLSLERRAGIVIALQLR